MEKSEIINDWQLRQIELAQKKKHDKKKKNSLSTLGSASSPMASGAEETTETNNSCYLITLQWNENKIISNLVQVRKTPDTGGGISFIDQA